MCAICLFGCGVSALSGGPKSNDAVYGNGGFSVVKGDYLYFSNAYFDYNNLSEGENKYDFNSSKKVYGIFRVKLNENRLVNLDEDGVPKGAELMVPQIGAYAYSGLYICGDYLYYTTPFTGNDKGTYVKGLITFERVNLNRTGHKVIYKTEEYSSSCKYFINYFNGTTYITILNTSSNITLLSVKGENTQTKTIASGVSSIACPEQNNLSNSFSVDDNSRYIYYTKKDGNYYSMYKKSILNPSQREQLLVGPTTNELELINVKNNRVYFKEDSYVKSSTFEDNSDVKVYSNQQLAGDSETGLKSFYVLNDSNGANVDRGIVGVNYDGSTYSVSIYNGVSQPLFSNAKQIDILFESNNCIYYQIADDNALYCCDISNPSQTRTIAKEFLTKIDESTNVYDFDFDHGFYFNTVESANNTIKYLHMVNLNGLGYENEDGEAIGHYIGVLDASKMN